MQTIRFTTPTAHRICRPASRAIPSFHPRYATPAAFDFAPNVFRFLDDVVSASEKQTRRTFNPRFDVRETKDAYTLEGELPGVDPENVTVEWTDRETLSIRGRREERSETSSEEQEASTAATEPVAEPAADTASNAGSSHQATVEDEFVAVEHEHESNETNEKAAKPAASETPAPQQAKPESKWWISERSSGEFARTFNFAGRVDQENVRASLKNGVLAVVVPKAAIEGVRRVAVE